MSQKNVVVALLDQAQGEHRRGDTARAAASLERALRIEPRNPVIWHRLARLRMEQGDYAQAQSLAAKSNALAPTDAQLRSQNWQLIGEARRRSGDRRGAEEAFARAQSVLEP